MDPNAIPDSDGASLTAEDYSALAAFRFQIRRFLHFSESAARQERLEPQQHQLLLAVKALEGRDSPTVTALAGYLLIRHHSAVGLIDRLVLRGYLQRARSQTDRRQVLVRLTEAGEEKLRRLSKVHREELQSSGPFLVETLRGVLRQ